MSSVYWIDENNLLMEYDGTMPPKNVPFVGVLHSKMMTLEEVKKHYPEIFSEKNKMNSITELKVELENLVAFSSKVFDQLRERHDRIKQLVDKLEKEEGYFVSGPVWVKDGVVVPGLILKMPQVTITKTVEEFR